MRVRRSTGFCSIALEKQLARIGRKTTLRFASAVTLHTVLTKDRDNVMGKIDWLCRKLRRKQRRRQTVLVETSILLGLNHLRSGDLIVKALAVGAENHCIIDQRKNRTEAGDGVNDVKDPRTQADSFYESRAIQKFHYLECECCKASCPASWPDLVTMSAYRMIGRAHPAATEIKQGTRSFACCSSGVMLSKLFRVSASTRKNIHAATTGRAMKPIDKPVE